jgi:hypothetical protein
VILDDLFRAMEARSNPLRGELETGQKQMLLVSIFSLYEFRQLLHN